MSRKILPPARSQPEKRRRRAAPRQGDSVEGTVIQVGEEHRVRGCQRQRRYEHRSRQARTPRRAHGQVGDRIRATVADVLRMRLISMVSGAAQPTRRRWSLRVKPARR
jgi:hypothetical protein